MNTTQQGLIEAQQRLQAALAAEAARLAAANAPNTEIEQAQQEIVRLMHQQRQEAFSQRSQANSEAVKRCFELHRQMIVALREGNISAAFQLKDQADQAWQTHKRAFLAAMTAVMNDIMPLYAERVDGLTNLILMQHEMRATGNDWERQLAKAYGTGYALLQWIADAGTNTIERQIRQGLTFCLMGAPVYDPSPGYNAAQAFQAADISYNQYAD